MSRLLFEKSGNAVWISHLDLMRLFQRAFKRAGLPLKHTQGFNPRPSVSIALPLSVGVESLCELLDFDLEGDPVPEPEILDCLNQCLVDGVRGLNIYRDGMKLKNLCYLDCTGRLEYDQGIPEQAEQAIRDLFHREHLLVEKKGKNGIQEQDIIPMIRQLELVRDDPQTLVIQTRICCQNPTLNPTQLIAAIERYIPVCKPDFSRWRRNEIYTAEETIFR